MLYGGFQSHGTCTIEKATVPLAENMCQGLRAGLEESCDRLLEVPLGKTGIYLAGAYTVKPVSFPPLVKEKVGEAYSACVGFWSGSIDYETYQSLLEQKASVLTAMFKAVGKPTEGIVIRDVAVASGARREKIVDETIAAADIKADCINLPEKKCAPITSKPEAPDEHFQAGLDSLASNKLSAALVDLAAAVKQLRPLDPLTSTAISWKQAAETGFATGSYKVGKNECAKLRAEVARVAPDIERIFITGSADERGTQTGNETLSRQRAATAAQCLAGTTPPKNWIIEITGTGAFPTSTDGFARARRATVFIPTKQP